MKTSLGNRAGLFVSAIKSNEEERNRQVLNNLFQFLQPPV